MADYQQNFMNALQGGLQFGQQIKGIQDQRQIGQLAGQAYGAPRDQRQSLLGQLAQISPQAASAQRKQWSADDETDQEELVNMARFIKAAPPEQQMQVYQSSVLPKLRERGMQAPDWTPETQQTILQTVDALVSAYGGLDGSTPAGLREFQGMTQGLPQEDVMRARRIALGLDGRASSAGFSQVKFTDSQGRERIGVLNGKTGQIDLPDGTSFNPQTGAISQTQGAGPAVVPQGGTQQIVDAIAEQANRMIAAGMPEAQVTTWAEQQLQGGAQGSMPQPVGAGGDTFTGRRKEDEAAAIEAAKQRTQLQFLPEELALRTQADIDKTTGVETAKNQADRAKNEPKARLALEQATARVNRVDSLVDSIMPRIGTLTAGWLGGKLSGVDGTAAADLRRDLGTLQAIAGFDELNAMRAASPTGGALGNVTERELAFLQSVVRNIENSQSPEQLRRNLAEFQQELKGSWQRVANAYQQDYGQSMQGAPAAQGRGPQPGTVEDGYRFRGGDPADPNNWERM